MAALDFYRDSDLFSEEDRLVIDLTKAALQGPVPDDLFEQAKDLYGEKGMLEFSVAIGWWTLWTIIINVLRPEVDVTTVDKSSD